MKLELTREQVDLIIHSLYYANCRLGPGLLGNGKYKEEAFEIRDIIVEVRKDEK
jgi:hypothetical protein